jgi:hypothetical protein
MALEVKRHTQQALGVPLSLFVEEVLRLNGTDPIASKSE